MKTCELPWSSILICTNGKCYNCCYQDGSMPIGDLTQQTPEEVWNGPVVQEIRRSWMDGVIPPACQAGIGNCVHLGRG